MLGLKLNHVSKRGPRWVSLDPTDDKSPLVQVMVWCRRAKSHNPSQCWPRFMLPYGVTRSRHGNFRTAAKFGDIRSAILVDVIWSRDGFKKLYVTSTVYWCMASNLKALRNLFLNEKKIHLCVGLSVCNILCTEEALSSSNCLDHFMTKFVLYVLFAVPSVSHIECKHVWIYIISLCLLKA